MARSLSRSVWAVLGAFGLLFVISHFVFNSESVLDLIPLYAVGGEDDRLETWELALVYTGLGVGYVLLGQFLRQPVTHDEPPPPG
jgi:hypothetical protein